MVAVTWQGNEILLHPNLADLIKTHLNATNPGRAKKFLRLEAGNLAVVGFPSLVTCGLGIKVVGVKSIERIGKMLEKIGMVRVDHAPQRGGGQVWVVPESMMKQWLLDGTFIRTTWELNRYNPKLDAALAEGLGLKIARGRNPRLLGEAAIAKRVVGTVTDPGRYRLEKA